MSVPGRSAPMWPLSFMRRSEGPVFYCWGCWTLPPKGKETTGRYLIDNKRITEEMFFKGKYAPDQFPNFARPINPYANGAKTQIEAKKMIKSRFGRIEDKFSVLFPKRWPLSPLMISRILYIPMCWTKKK